MELIFVALGFVFGVAFDRLVIRSMAHEVAQELDDLRRGRRGG